MAKDSNPIAYLSKKTWEYSKGNRKNVVVYMFLFIVANIIGFLPPLIFAWLLNTIQLEGITEANILKLLGIALLLFIENIVFWIFHGPARVIERTNAFWVKTNYKKYLADGVMNLPLRWHTDHHSGDTIDKIEKGTQALHRYSSQTFEVIEVIIRFISSYIILAFFNVHASYIVLFMVILAITIILKMDNTLRKQYKQLFRAANKISARVYDVVSNITTVIIIRIRKLLSNEIMRIMLKPYKLYVANAKYNELKWFIVSVCAGIMTFAVLGSYIYGKFAAGETILIGSLSALYGYIGRINQVFFRFAYRYGDIVKQKSAVENAEEIAEHFAIKTPKKKIDLDRSWNILHINNLSFAYESKEGELNLHNISLSIKKNEKIALVGESGSGKTTFLKLLRGLYDPDKVNLFVNKTKTTHNFKSISHNITLIPQDPELFATTIRKNITLGKVCTMKKLRKVTDMACFTKVADSLPRKFESSIVERGVNLSGGEKQRLALARGILAAEHTPIILLDEPTSSVDSKNELKIYNHIFTKFKNRTIISSIHRLHLLKMFDRVYYFKKGKIVARGTVKELLSSSKEFKRLWDKYHKTE